MRSRAIFTEEEIDPTAKTLARLVTDPSAGPSTDWEVVVHRAVDERMAPVLFSRIGNDRRVPERYRSLLRAELYRAEAWNLIQYRGLRRLLERSVVAGLDSPVLLKGAALASSLYEEIGHRPMSDIDLLVSRGDLDRWLALTQEASFRRLSPEMAKGLEDAVHYHVALVEEPGDGAMVEIHYGLVSGESDWRAPDLGWFFDRTESFRFPLLSARQLDPTAHLLYLAAHALLQHGASAARMIWFYDVHLLVSKWGDRVRWDELVRKAWELGWDAALLHALDRSRTLFGTELPERPMRELQERTDEDRIGEVRRRGSRSRSRAEVVWSELRSASVKNGVFWSLAILFPRPEYMRWRYPDAGRFWPLWYPYRWARVVREGYRAILGLAPPTARSS